MTREERRREVTPGTSGELGRRQVPVAWEALEDAFENNAPEVHSYLHLATGEVTRIVDGVADPAVHARLAHDPGYLRIDPVSSREQYRWMERFIATVEDPELRARLMQAIEGKGAFRRFKDVLMGHPIDRERWFAFRSERLRACMEVWLEAHGIVPMPRAEWRVPTAEQVRPQLAETEAAPRRGRAQVADQLRARLHELVEALAVRDLDAAVAFLEFLRERRHVPRGRSRGAESEPAVTDAATAETSVGAQQVSDSDAAAVSESGHDG
ncbi:MAG: UPF0158 family protein [Myxococcota bacterium]|nr:UPF0158 family protein [Myxococcota bacterium]MDW8361770.1 UPF0158 family protein [Myxococcales bacterium]